MHLATMHKQIRDFQPAVVVVDPISNFTSAGPVEQAGSMLMRLVDFLKTSRITALFTNLTAGGMPPEQTEIGISSLIDTWILLRDIELYGERNRGIYILKSRGMAHSNQIREMLLTNQGVELTDVYLGPDGVLTGSARLAQELREKDAAVVREQEMERRRRSLSRRRKALEAQIATLQSELEAEEDEGEQLQTEESLRRTSLERERWEMARSRRADDASSDGRANGSGAIR
jgi:circadian clock protein KaiC